jgi:hypothetical protein
MRSTPSTLIEYFLVCVPASLLLVTFLRYLEEKSGYVYCPVVVLSVVSFLQSRTWLDLSQTTKPPPSLPLLRFPPRGGERCLGGGLVVVDKHARESCLEA